MNAQKTAPPLREEGTPGPSREASWILPLAALLAGAFALLFRRELPPDDPEQARRRRLLADLDEAVIATGLDGRILYLNPAAERLFGYPMTAATGTPLGVLVPPELRGEWAEVCAQVQRGETVAPFATVRLHRSGARLDVDVAVVLSSDPAGRPVGLVVLHHDARERQARRERDFLRAMLESIGEPVIACDAQGNLIFFNRAAEQLHGPQALPLPPATWAERFQLCRPDGQTPLPLEEVPLSRALMGETVREVEMVVSGTNGRRTLVCNGQRLTDAQGQPLGAVMAMEDVTERRRLEEQLRRSQKMEALGRLAGGIAHDFNNLLTVIMGYGDVLLLSLPKGTEAHDLVVQIHKAGEQAATLTRQLLSFSRRQAVAPRVLDLNAIIHDMQRILTRTLGEDIDLATALAPDTWPVRADPGQLEQVLMNLVVNARDAMPQGGQLTIATRNVKLDQAYAEAHAGVKAGRYVHWEISDTGHGIPEAIRHRIFEPFFTTKEPGQGTGLGLATVFGIVQQAGGHIELYSEPGTGTTFKIYLPKAEETPTAAPLSAIRPAPHGSETVLLVEDDEAVRVLGLRVLHNCGYTVLEASNGEAALRLAQQHVGPIHLLVTDVVMPGIGGRSLAERLSETHPEMKVLFLSGFSDDAVVRHGLLEGEVNFLQKPFSPVILAHRIREVLDG